MVGISVRKGHKFTKVLEIAGLERNIPVPFAWITDYNSGNEKEVNKLWESMSIDKGIIAISIEEAAANNLPKSQPFPWDQDKGIYLVNGFHNLHCLVSSLLQRIFGF